MARYFGDTRKLHYVSNNRRRVDTIPPTTRIRALIMGILEHAEGRLIRILVPHTEQGATILMDV